MECQVSVLLREYLEQVAAILGKLPVEEMERVVNILHQARLHRRRVFVLGNGGSGATASHFACDLNKGAIAAGVPRFSALALTDNFPLFSAWANDSDYSQVFREQLENHLEPGDVVIGISCSGNSDNVVKALELARERGATTIAFTAFDGGRVKDIAQVCVLVPTSCMEQSEDIHLILGHSIATCLRKIASLTTV